jgi:hypothetical protein
MKKPPDADAIATPLERQLTQLVPDAINPYSLTTELCLAATHVNGKAAHYTLAPEVIGIDPASLVGSVVMVDIEMAIAYTTGQADQADCDEGDLIPMVADGLVYIISGKTFAGNEVMLGNYYSQAEAKEATTSIRQLGEPLVAAAASLYLLGEQIHAQAPAVDDSLYLTPSGAHTL